LAEQRHERRHEQARISVATMIAAGAVSIPSALMKMISDGGPKRR
jgi:hypothetical protein